MTTRDLLTEKEAAQELTVSPSLLRKWRMERTTLPFIRLGRRVVYRRSDIEAFIQKNTVATIGGVSQ